MVGIFLLIQTQKHDFRFKYIKELILERDVQFFSIVVIAIDMLSWRTIPETDQKYSKFNKR